MGHSRWFGFQGKLFGLIGLFLLGFLAVLAVMFTAISKVKIEGPLYVQIMKERDFINELTPPSLFIRTPYNLCLQMALETDPVRVKDLTEQFRKSEQDYTKSYEHWSFTLPDGPIRTSLREDAHGPAGEFFKVASRDFLPYLEAGVQAPQREKAIGVLKVNLRDLYDKQKAGTDKVAQLANESRKKVEASANDTLNYWSTVTVVVSIVVLVILILVGWYITRGIVGPTNELIHTMRDMAEGAGDLTARVKVTSNDEIGELASTINAVLQKIHDLVVSVRESSIQLYASSTEIAATAREQESTMQTLGASTNQIAAAVKQISATTHELSSTMNAVSAGGHQTNVLATAGRTGLTGMGNTMQRLAESTNSISSKLSVVREKANDINVVVTTITKVADQTNLLSINAAIEAEKAGEYGRGFLVVAREIRRLADQTAVATLDIENMVRQMQGAVSAGVMEMDKFTDEVRSGVGRVSEINGQMGQIIEQVHGLNDRFQIVNDSMAQQSGGTKQINDAMLSLAAGVQQTSASLKEFHSVTGNLRESADSLKQQVSKFKVSG